LHGNAAKRKAIEHLKRNPCVAVLPTNASSQEVPTDSNLWTRGSTRDSGIDLDGQLANSMRSFANKQATERS